MIHANENNYYELVKEGVVLVDFYANWCGPCKMLAPILETLSSQRSDVKIIKVNVDECPNIATSFDVLSIPTLLLYKDGKVLSNRMGFQTIEMLNEWISSVN